MPFALALQFLIFFICYVRSRRATLVIIGHEAFDILSLIQPCNHHYAASIAATLPPR